MPIWRAPEGWADSRGEWSPRSPAASRQGAEPPWKGCGCSVASGAWLSACCASVFPTPSPCPWCAGGGTCLRSTGPSLLTQAQPHLHHVKLVFPLSGSEILEGPGCALYSVVCFTPRHPKAAEVLMDCCLSGKTGVGIRGCSSLGGFVFPPCHRT